MTVTPKIAQTLIEESNYYTDDSLVSITAQNILDENNWSTDIIALDDLEALINNAINYVNLDANTSIALMSGTSESKTATMSRSESLAVKMVAALMVRAYRDQGSTAVATISVSSAIEDPQYKLFSDLIAKATSKLKTANPIYVEYLVTNAINLVNLHAGTTISDISGTPGIKSLSATNDETVVIKLVASQFLRNHMQGNMEPFELNDTLKKAITALKTSDVNDPPIFISNDPVST